jgi:MinD superfamily P-loop ATPase
MKQLLILSGKGGTGKTTVAAALIQLFECQAYADCDVDAPNLHLILPPSVAGIHRDFYGMDKFAIDANLCRACGVCETSCRFDAIHRAHGFFVIDSMACEGCGTCQLVCPANAIITKPHVAGTLMLYRDATLFSTAKLHPGGGNSGLLVSAVKRPLKNANVDWQIIDGSPGIGCPVIASLSGSDLVLLVTEPTQSGWSDMKRIVATAKPFHVSIVVAINKITDVDSRILAAIIAYCETASLPIVGRIPYDATVSMNINQGESILSSDSPASRAILAMYGKLKEHIESQKEGT